MKPRTYYSVRTGKHQQQIIPHEMMLELFFGFYNKLKEKGYFTEYFGFCCTDAGNVVGELGHDIPAAMFFKLRRNNLWPFEEKYKSYTRDELFDLIEFLYDCCSKPTEWYYHDWNSCGNHYTQFHKASGQTEFRSEINLALIDYEDGYELSEDGEILSLPDKGLETLLSADLPEIDKSNVSDKVEQAILKFRRRSSSDDERKDAIRDLADVLEFLRPKAKSVLLRKDENDLFAIANNFAIRHHNAGQQTEYDKPIWYSWMFYFYLSTIHATIRLIQKHSA